jgi:hypothetical protein
MHPDEYELYRIDDDFYETRDLASDPENAARIQTMKTDLLSFMESIGDPTYASKSGAPDKKEKKRNKRKQQSQ